MGTNIGLSTGFGTGLVFEGLNIHQQSMISWL